MTARNEVKRPPDLSLDARLALAAVQLRFAARVDLLVARWLERCTENIEATQGLSGISAAVVRWTARD